MWKGQDCSRRYAACIFKRIWSKQGMCTRVDIIFAVRKVYGGKCRNIQKEILIFGCLKFKKREKSPVETGEVKKPAQYVHLPDPASPCLCFSFVEKGAWSRHAECNTVSYSTDSTFKKCPRYLKGKVINLIPSHQERPVCWLGANASFAPYFLRKKGAAIFLWFLVAKFVYCQEYLFMLWWSLLVSGFQFYDSYQQERVNTGDTKNLVRVCLRGDSGKCLVKWEANQRTAAVYAYLEFNQRVQGSFCLYWGNN